MSNSSQSLSSRIETTRQLKETGKLAAYAAYAALKDPDEGRTNSWGPANRK